MALASIIIYIFTAIIIVAFICNVTIEIYALSKVYEDSDRIPVREYALVLGTTPKRADGEPNRYFKYRMNAAAELLHKGKVRRVILSGDKHDEYDEPMSMLLDLSEKGISPEVCLLDGKGYDTIDSILNAKTIVGTDTVTIISQDFHCERAVFLAGVLGLNAIAFAAQEVEPFWKSKTKLREIPARIKVFKDIITFYIKRKR